MSQVQDNGESICTQRLCLRPLSESDASLLYPILSHPDVMKWTPSGPVHGVDEARDWIRTRILGRYPFHFVIEPLEPIEGKNECIGTIGCYGPPYIGYLIHPKFAGQGYATDALRAVIPGVFDILHGDQDPGSKDDKYIEARTMANNVASQRVLVKCGFKLWQETQQSDSSSAHIKTYRLARADAVL